MNKNKIYLENLQLEASSSIKNISSKEEIENWRIDYLGRKGKISDFFQTFTNLQSKEKNELGSLANNIKNTLEKLYEEKSQSLNEQNNVTNEFFDFTLPSMPISSGSIHPTNQMMQEICAAFNKLGFNIFEGPEIESETYAFDKLNIPTNHPARDLLDTIYVKDVQEIKSLVLRPHTSPMQIRIMENNKPPIRVVIPGKCYRYEATDNTHEWHFHQIEGLVIDKNINFSNMKSTLFEFARIIFGEDTKARFRCDFFPFVEPGAEMSINFKQNEWLELMGAGMVHPKVLLNVGLDPEIYSGFAFGLGIERAAMIKYGIENIRDFYANDYQFLKQ
ncbi:MAG: phenylalanine--tRNA ligase subunit alpha, partial [SAR202 cluster bacterium]|nr:phenylalanine--tRNA ligase subunit alpha [SAR202 cluster bacterium]